MNNLTRNRVAMFGMFCIFETAVFLIEKFNPTFHLSVQEWIMLIFAASLGGRAVAYLAIGEWIRWPLTKVVQHSSGTGESTEPKYEGFRHAPGVLLSCPICAGTWMGAVLIGLLSIFPDFGRMVLYALSVGGAAMVVSRFLELIEATRYVTDEVNGHWNRKNKEEQGIQISVPVADVVEEKKIIHIGNEHILVGDHFI